MGAGRALRGAGAACEADESAALALATDVTRRLLRCAAHPVGAALLELRRDLAAAALSARAWQPTPESDGAARDAVRGSRPPLPGRSRGAAAALLSRVAGMRVALADLLSAELDGPNGAAHCPDPPPPWSEIDDAASRAAAAALAEVVLYGSAHTALVAALAPWNALAHYVLRRGAAARLRQGPPRGAPLEAAQAAAALEGLRPSRLPAGCGCHWAALCSETRPSRKLAAAADICDAVAQASASAGGEVGAEELLPMVSLSLSRAVCDGVATELITHLEVAESVLAGSAARNKQARLPCPAGLALLRP